MKGKSYWTSKNTYKASKKTNEDYDSEEDDDEDFGEGEIEDVLPIHKPAQIVRQSVV